MKTSGHLLIEEIQLPPGREWMIPGAGWRFARVDRGAAYWLGDRQTRSLAEGEILVIAPGIKGAVRASQIGDVRLQAFNFAPELLCGFFTLAERHFFESAAGAALREIQFLPSTHPIARQFAAVAGSPAACGGLAHRVEMLRLVAAVFEDAIASHPLPASGGTALGRFTQLIAQMPDTEIINYSPGQLAQVCGCSPRHFNRLFRKCFGTSTRARQTELRLLKARQLLGRSDTKIIHVALESGYRNLSLFNALFKRRFGMTPSEWRRRAAGKNGRSLVAAGLLLLLSGATRTGAAETNSPPSTPVPARQVPPSVSREEMGRIQEALRRKMEALDERERRAALLPFAGSTNTIVATNGPTFEVKRYEVDGNTLLPTNVIDIIMRPYAGSAMTLAAIHQGLADLQMTYRNRGFVTVAVSLPPQKLTNGIVRVQVTEGRLAEIRVLGNRYFSSNNVMRDLPSLRTNTFLNSLVFQQELDRANANRDRQIYPVISAGPEPGTSLLDLKVKDRLPLHAHFEFDNYSTPGTPELRANAAAVANNLWQLNHQVGLQYTFTPEATKDGSVNLYDRPLIANYSFFYRLPLSGVNGPARDGDYSWESFGYDEAARRFRPPPPGGASELLFYASRSSSDTGRQVQSRTLTPAVVPPEGTLQVSDEVFNRTLNPNEDVGARFSQPLPQMHGIDASLSAGVDFKNYRATLLQSRVFQATLFVPEFGSNGPPFIEFPSPATESARTNFTSARYLPLSWSFEATSSDPRGTTRFNFGQSFNVPGLLSGDREFRAVTGATNATAAYVIVTAGLTRDEKVYRDWGVLMHADGQWADGPLISNEQFGLGGQAGVRGYRDGAVYGDSGWRLQVEPHTPYRNLGLVFDKVPMVARGYAFIDYGKAYSLNPAAPHRVTSLLGTGCGLDVSIGEHVDMHVSVGLPLLDVPGQASDRLRTTFSLSAQF